MSRSTRSRAPIAVLALIALSCACGGSSNVKPYEFRTSGLGTEWQQLRHNIFGFSIDIPIAWTFGVNGAPPAAVILVFPRTLNTAQFSADFGMVEIGLIPPMDGGLSEAASAVLRGMREKHGGVTLEVDPHPAPHSAGNAISFRMSWVSKSGFRIVEDISLISSQQRTFSLAIRATSEEYAKNQLLYSTVAKTFRPIR